jgi:hypothetical protein
MSSTSWIRIEALVWRPPPVGEPLGLSAVHGAAQTPPPSRPRGKSGAVGPGAEARRRGPAPGGATGWAGPDGAAGRAPTDRPAGANK